MWGASAHAHTAQLLLARGALICAEARPGQCRGMHTHPIRRKRRMGSAAAQILTAQTRSPVIWGAVKVFAGMCGGQAQCGSWNQSRILGFARCLRRLGQDTKPCGGSKVVQNAGSCLYCSGANPAQGTTHCCLLALACLTVPPPLPATRVSRQPGNKLQDRILLCRSAPSLFSALSQFSSTLRSCTAA
jgi:hypothetical protein